MPVADRRIILDQVRRLAAIPADRAPEGLIFYCARMLDGITAGLVTKLGQKASANIFSNLMTIEAHRLIDNVYKELAHTLRRMGNLVRHSLEDSSREDATLAIVLVREMVRWFEALEPGDEFQDALARLNAEIDASSRIVSIVGLLSDVEDGVEGAVGHLLARTDDMLASRFLATLCAEALIACGNAGPAGELLSHCANEYGSDQRHQQLSALVLSRTGRLEEAEQAAARLLKSYPDDDETSGIAGGIFKRRWDRDSMQGMALKKAHDLYRKQWERGKKINAYLGVNAAATAVYLGNVDLAHAIASAVVAAMERRDEALTRAGLTPQDGGLAEYYDRVSRAEALLIGGKVVEAQEAYQSAFHDHRMLTGSIEGTRSQAARIAATLQFHSFTL